MTIINVIAVSWRLKVSGKQFTGTACEWLDEIKESFFVRGRDPSPPGAGGRGILQPSFVSESRLLSEGVFLTKHDAERYSCRR